MKKELTEILDSVESEKHIPESKKLELANLVEKADRRLVSKDYHLEVLRKYKKSKRLNWANFFYFISGMIVSLIGIYFYLADNKQKTRLISQYVNNISELCSRRAYNAARELLEKAEKIDASDERLTLEKLHIDLEESLENQSLQSKELIDRCEVALKSNPENIWLNNNLALLYYKTGETMKAETSFKKNLLLASRVKSFDLAISGAVNLATMFTELGRLDSALVYYKKADTIFNNYKNLSTPSYKSRLNTYLFNYARWHYFNRDIDTCVAQLDRYVKRDNLNEVDLGQAFLLKAEAMQETRAFDSLKNERKKQLSEEIENAYLQAVKYLKINANGYSSACGSLGYFYTLNGNCEKGLQYLKEALQTAVKAKFKANLIRIFGYNTIGNLECKRYEDAFLFNQLTLQLSRRTNNTNLLNAAKIDSIQIMKYLPLSRVSDLIKKAEKQNVDYDLD